MAVDPRTLAGIAFIALAAQFMTAIMLAAAMVSGYDFQGGAISDLGVFPETALLFNLSLIVAGVINLLGGYAFYRLHGRGWLLAIFAIASVGAIGAGLFPLDTGGLHSLAAVLAFVFFNVEAIGSASVLGGAMRALSVVAGVVGLVFIGLMVVGDAGTTAAFGPIGHGGTERMIIYPVMIWLIAVGGALVGANHVDDRRPA
ncbi:DUF998 domain-containing protein [Halococcoides cellulosivorans]|uniref:DUF998 domain-containing protein n=1 Tax=Halococcoides cellulosivorans TaxID=1679096 RepID=A0A2R4X486_9EURY|nr:DUF998 domain-containing protein [Halococcoides cellulosivorans]